MNSSKLRSASAILAVAALLAWAFLSAPASLAQTVPLAQPNLEIPIPEVSLSKAVAQNGTVTIPFLAEYIAGVYAFLISIVGVLAGVMMVIGGFQYLTSGGDKSKVDAGKKRIINALSGLVLALGSYLLLFTINPDLVEFKALQLTTVDIHNTELHDLGDVDEAAAPASGPSTGPATAGKKACDTIDTCRTLCEQDPSKWPASTKGMLDPSLAVSIGQGPGYSSAPGTTASKPVVDGLKRAGQIALKKNATYRIEVTSGYRPLKRQIEIVCNEFIIPGDRLKAEGKTAAANKLYSRVGVSVAWPGGSNHGYGTAIDVHFYIDGKKAVYAGDYTGQSGSQYREPSTILLQIMTEAGFKRYSKEIWHFEIGSTSKCRCTYPSCPWPPSC